MDKPPEFRWLFIDMNAYFASAEQEARPELRGRPVAVAALAVETTACIAASYEAKAAGIKTGTPIGEARRRCPDLAVVVARPEYYVRLHHRIEAAVRSVIPIDGVLSIDEFACRLTGTQREPAAAVALAKAVKGAIREQAGQTLRCSAGIAPNRVLAKTACDMQKPDGLTLLPRSTLPGALHRLALDDLPGVGPRMLARLHRHGITSMEQMGQAPKERLREVWGGIVGERWWHWLRGDDLPEPPTRRATVGHSHVLPPELRTAAGAWAVAIKLLDRAAARMRRMGYYAGRLSVAVTDLGASRGWEGTAKLGLCRDTPTLLDVLGDLWLHRPRTGTPLKVAVTLWRLSAVSQTPRSLFEEDRQRERLSEMADEVNERFGAARLHTAAMQPARDAAPVRISFTHIPDELGKPQARE